MLEPVSSIGTVRVWHGEEGWGVIDSADTPGGCWTHFGHVAVPGHEPFDTPVSGTPSGAHTSAPWFPTLTGIIRYPVKSCRGQSLDEAAVEPWGLAGDRRWMLVDDDGVFVTARKYPRMVLVTPRPRPDGLIVKAPGVAPLAVRFPQGGPRTGARVWRSTVDAALADDESHAWFSALLGIPVRLVHLDDPTLRHTDPRYGRDTDVVSFADGYPVLLTSEESLAALDERCPEPLTMTRFRPNLVVTGFPAWDEDGWRRVRIGDATFRVVKPCSRCVLTTVDPETGVKGPEPLRTLARHRRWDGTTWFGVNLVPDTPGAVLHLGDPVEVLGASGAPRRW